MLCIKIWYDQVDEISLEASYLELYDDIHLDSNVPFIVTQSEMPFTNLCHEFCKTILCRPRQGPQKLMKRSMYYGYFAMRCVKCQMG